MSIETLIIIATIIAGLIILFILIKRQKPSSEILAIIKMLEQGGKDDRKMLLESLSRNTEAINTRLDKAAQVIASVQRNIGEVSEIGRSMQELQELLRSPKLRGTIGEQILKDLLSQLLPKQTYKLQYRFKSGAIVDAMVKTAAGIIPIDAKFPIEGFRAMNKARTTDEKKTFYKQFVLEVKKHIKDIGNKYIAPDEGTLDYALMYIPSEAIYYEIVNSNELFAFAGENRVLPVSPTTFYAFLKAILMSFEGQKIEQQAQQILASLRTIQKDYQKMDSLLTLLGKHLTNAYNAMTDTLRQFKELGQKLRATETIEKEENKQLPLS